jgi:hypothetical protein
VLDLFPDRAFASSERRDEVVVRQRPEDVDEFRARAGEQAGSRLPIREFERLTIGTNQDLSVLFGLDDRLELVDDLDLDGRRCIVPARPREEGADLRRQPLQNTLSRTRPNRASGQIVNPGEVRPVASSFRVTR